MKFLIVNTDYPAFLQSLYEQHSGLKEQLFAEQMRARYDSLFSDAGFYSNSLRALGHEAWDIRANNEFAQKAWMREHGLKLRNHVQLQVHRWRSRVPFILMASQWFEEALTAQVKYYQPDVLLNQAMDCISTTILRKIKPYVRLLVGQHASPALPACEDYSCYDLVVSSFPPTVELFRHKGITSELNRLAFEPNVLSCVGTEQRVFDVTFIGSFHRMHSSRTALLNDLCARFPSTKVWGHGIDYLPSSSPIRKSYMGKAWGRDMYQILAQSKMTLNHHGNVPPYANNFRLFESTGMGTLLITDWKENLHEMFEPGKEVVAYHSLDDCAEQIDYYLRHDDEREAIARAGQERTLRDHTFRCRMQEFVDIVGRYL